MNKLFHLLMLAVAVGGFGSLPLFAGDPPSLDELQGRWTVHKTNQDGRRYSYNLEIKQSAFAFELRDGEGQVRLFAKGAVKTEKSGPFKMLSFTDVQAGRTADELAPVDDTRIAIYTVFGNKLHLVTNFDKDRDNETPTLDVYTRVGFVKSVPGGASGPDAIYGEWKLVVTIGENQSDYTLRVEKGEGEVNATLISPRSGEYKAKAASFKDNQLVVELTRNYGGRPTTFLYEAKLVDGELEGTIKNKDADGRVTGSFKGTK